jgi:hypothetical protein
MSQSFGDWAPTRLERVEESYDTSMGTTKIKTDATWAYIKALGNRQGPHLLAAELVATQLARWFGLKVADFAVIDLPQEACFDLPRGNKTNPGPAFVSRHADGATWGGSEAELRTLENQDDITRLVVFDTWVRNCDRHPPDLTTRRPNYANVYLADTDRPTRTRLLAIDHTHCFDCGRDLTTRLSHIEIERDMRTYGLFPAFSEFIAQFELRWCASTLQSLKVDDVRKMVESIPAAWEVEQPARTALCELISRRALFVADRIDHGWWPGDPA